MAIAPTKLKPSFGKWISTEYSERSYSDLYVYCIHAIKRGIHKIVEAELSNRLKSYLEFVEIPLHDNLEISSDSISDFRELRSRLDELKFDSKSNCDQTIIHIFEDYARALDEPNWNSWIKESKTAIDMYMRYIHFKGEQSELCGQTCYVQEIYRNEIGEILEEGNRPNMKEIELSYDPSLLIVGDDNDIKKAIRSALKGLKVNDNNRVTKVSIKSNLITISLEQT